MRSWPLDCGLDCGDRKEQVKLIIEERDETVFLVERFCLLVDRIHLDGMDAEFVGKAMTLLKRVDQEAHAPSLSLNRLVHRQAGQKNTGTGCKGSLRAELSGRFWKTIEPEASV